MKLAIFAIPAVVGLLAGAAHAEGPDLTLFGTQWSATLGDRFFTDSTLTTLRNETDISAAWAELSEPDQQLILDDCRLMRDGTTAGAGAGMTEAKGTAAQGTGTVAAGATLSTDNAAGGGDLATVVAVSAENMIKLCDLVAPK